MTAGKIIDAYSGELMGIFSVDRERMDFEREIVYHQIWNSEA